MTDRLKQAADLFEKMDGLNCVLKDESLSRHCSFRTGGPADLFVSVKNPAALTEVIRILKDKQIPYYILGRGTNLLIGDAGYRGCIITMTGNRIDTDNEMSSVAVNGTEITAGAGASMAALAAAAAENSLSGLEFAGGIPGSVGGGLVMNAGAYGGELKDVVRSVTVLEENGDIRVYSADEMNFGYRNSILKRSGGIVLSAVFGLTLADPDDIRTRMQELAARRSDKQPLEYPSAGSTFKRPEGYFAGKLIEDAGLRGFSVGGAQVSEKHCGFVINRNDATSAEIRDLIKAVREKVKTASGVTLEEEVIYLGEF